MGNARNLAFWAVLFLLILALFNLFGDGQSSTGSRQVAYSDFISAVDRGEVRSAQIDGEDVRYQSTDGTTYSTVKPVSDPIAETLISKGVTVNVVKQQQSGFMSLLGVWLPFIVMIGIWIFFMNRMQGGGKGGAMGFGKSKAKLLTEKQGRVTFDDVAGIDEAKEELEEIVEFLRNPQKFSRLGGKIPKGALLVGPPGTGKTLLARAIAGEAGVPFFTISGSDFVEMFVGVGASRVRDMFEQAKKNAPCIVFIDEIDAVGRARGVGIGGGNDEREQTLNQLLVEMDGFEANEGIIIIAATNRRDVLDPALLRPGRFDRQIHVPNPDIKGREKILNVHARKVPVGPDVDLRLIARGTPGFSGADLANLCNEAALMAARVGRRFVTMEDFENAKDKVMMGVERRSMVLTPEQKEMTAYHEAGHAVVGLKLPKCDPVYKATIIPRGQALGMVVSLPEMDRLNYHKDEAKQKIAMTMAGKAAEILKWGEEHVSNGPAGDIQQASAIARAMVMRWGMSDKVGNIDYAEAHEGYSGNTGGFSVSTKTKELIEEEVRELIEAGYQDARRILLENQQEWERLAQGLLEYETLTGDEIRKVMAGEPIQSDSDGDSPSGSMPSVTSVPKTKPAPKGGDVSPEPSV
ncbi:ATP-dependent zinc metalloprotease FtsH [Paenirhodobacter populi]|uniref:ATP-dependent zinc metalloprotease FtsH n=1 Tax=Paenirhodobacter populi TaxID=2306993 RepID=A0A443JT25_9RHOB|nr:ATP-dependent zinc metalloprotease FtsH [Sinirhodobacter populi]RWR07990.1 ATP-dependent metallopeptidase FtsH/Yme1/Tma family protein [Sinirhodobacter populi]RWR08899.1 ATP-dependent metallopeptidase FtsH/Yme1/Tma family protein [Sinirhodobacter populi]RWR23652.1 ATP-dependent metallopeptidase FtsH/Yme1/Tma family protein [Sinirhodobacter populi]RWR30297.1 ATP-dependent metallopeptidase FtsH/Yme1/Tma family protein [Sinirhodobacter populi]RWR32270.1 ATP-dependent metallopeptidase FtsH/Yme1